MGLNTTVVIMNDAAGAIEDDPEFNKHLIRTVTDTRPGPKDVSAGGHPAAAVVLETHHSSVMRSVWVGGNTGIVQDVFFSCKDLRCDGFETGSQDSSDVKLLKAVAEELGYRVVKKQK